MYYVYQIVDEDTKFYTGYTSDLRERIKRHNAGDNESTKGKIWKLVYYEAYLSEKDAKRREKQIKDSGQARRFLRERIKDSISEASSD